MNIKLNKINKSFGSQFEIKNLDMNITSEKFTTFLGPSGCGKTTILRMIAGLEKPDSGEIWFDDICIYSSEKKIDVSPEKRNIGFVFQDFALWPHMTVFENVAFPLKARHQKENIKEKVIEVLKAVQLEKYADRRPEQLSGGQQQRVAFARAIVGNPKCVLFDEPLSALDAILRDEMRVEIKRLTNKMGITSVFVTHDQIEAMSMSDTIFVFNKGQIEQGGSPEDIYMHPETKFVANFIGKSNWIDENQMFRPEALTVIKNDNSLEYEAEIIDQQFIGNSYEVHLNMNGNRWLVQSSIKQHNKKMLIYIDKNKIVGFNTRRK